MCFAYIKSVIMGENDNNVNSELGESKPEVAASISTESKIPPFWKCEPELWFCRVEATFSRARITNSLTKFEIIVPLLDLEVLRQVADIVKKPTATPYEDLKDRLVSTYTESVNKRVQRLFEDRKLGDEKPSQYLRQIKRQAGEEISAEVITPIWLRALPAHMQAILLATGHTDVEKLAEVADKVHEVEPRRELCAVAGTSSSSSSSLEEKVDKLAQQVAELVSRRDRGRSGGRNSSRSRSRSSGRKPPGDKVKSENWLCYYHYKFKEKAHKCIQPCAWKEGPPPKKGNQ